MESDWGGLCPAVDMLMMMTVSELARCVAKTAYDTELQVSFDFCNN